MKRFMCILVCIMCAAHAAQAEERLRVVATLSTFADLAKQVGGAHVEAVAVAPPRFNPHFIEPRPSDIVKLKRADLFLHSGLDLEPWLTPLVDAAARPQLRPGGEREVDLSRGIELLNVPDATLSRSAGDIHLHGNPHYWLDPRNGAIMARTIAEKLKAIDSEHAADYQSNLEGFIEKLGVRMKDWLKIMAPYQGQKFVGYHDEWVYLMRFSGCSMERFLEPKPGIPPSPLHLNALLEYMDQEDIPAIIQASFYPREAAEFISERSKAKILIMHQNVGESPQVGDYISLIESNIQTMVSGMTRG